MIVMAGLAGLCVVLVVVTAAMIQGALTEDAYFRGSARLWGLLGLVVAFMTAALGPTVMLMSGYRGAIPLTSSASVLGWIAVPAAVVVVGCFANAWLLERARRRRRYALAHGEEIDAVVVARDQRAFAHDILSITLEAQIESTMTRQPSRGYRNPAPEPQVTTQAVQFVETCPGDQWSRLEPGARVRVRVVADDLSRYALVLF